MLKTNLSDLIGFMGAGEVPKKEDELAKSLKERQSEKVLEDYEKNFRIMKFLKSCLPSRIMILDFGAMSRA